MTIDPTTETGAETRLHVVIACVFLAGCVFLGHRGRLVDVTSGIVTVATTNKQESRQIPFNICIIREIPSVKTSRGIRGNILASPGKALNPPVGWMDINIY